MEAQELIRGITRWDMMRGMVYPCLAPRGWKKPKSGRAVYRRFLDLSIYYIARAKNGDDMMSLFVDKPLIDKWGIGMDTLDAQARENAKKDGYTIQDAAGTIEADPSHMYVLTNRYCLYGAAGMLDKTMLAQFADEKGSDIYIIPSSVHELILLPAAGAGDKEILDRMVRDMNGIAVGPGERLADHTYLYERSGKIRIS